MTAREFLPAGVRALRDRGQGLYLSRERVHSPYFVCAPRGDWWVLTPAPALTAVLERREPFDALTRSLARFRGLDPDARELALLCAALKLAEKPRADDAAALERALRAHAALCLRNKAGGGGLYACAVVLQQARPRAGDPQKNPLSGV